MKHIDQKKQGATRAHKKSYPWQSPFKLAVFCFALVLSGYLIITMPIGQKVKRGQESTTKSMQDVRVLDQGQDTNVVNTPAQKNTQNPVQKTTEESAFDKVLKKIKSFTRLFLMVGVAAFLAGLMEARSWHLFLGAFLRSITRAARLPQVIGVSMPVALYSNASANALLVSSHEQGQISTAALITGGMANSYLAHFSHSMRVLYPVVALIGLPGALYFVVQMLGGFLVIVIAFSINRYKCRTVCQDDWRADTTGKHKKLLPWKEAIALGFMRALTLLFRMAYITIPLMLGMEWLLKSGAFNFWEQHIPVQVARYFPAELVSIIIAQIGGLVQSAAVSAHLHTEGLVNSAQILLAMLVASAVGNPIRTLRRNLPTALGVFTPKVACTIVFTMQVARFLITVVGAGIVIVWMHLYLFSAQ